MSDHTEIAWAAGFFDGEGSTCTGPRGHGLQLHIGQIDKETLSRFQRAIGGSGHIGGPYPKATNRQPMFCYRLYGIVEVKRALELLWPYLCSTKRQQATRALAKSDSRPGRHLNSARQFDTCKFGHSFTAENIYIRPSDGGRECRACRAIRHGRAA